MHSYVHGKFHKCMIYLFYQQATDNSDPLAIFNIIIDNNAHAFPAQNFLEDYWLSESRVHRDSSLK